MSAQIDCGAAKNYYEKTVFANNLSTAMAINSADTLSEFARVLLSRSDAGGDVGGVDPSLASLRPKIKAVRTALGLNDVLPPLSDQITPALIAALKRLPPRP